jgi:DNA-binding CsgD family transcriptional regulator
MRLVAPHVQRAVLISDFIENQTVERNRFAHIIDTIATPTVIVESSLRIVHANEAGRAMLQAGGLVSSANGSIRLPNAVASAVLSGCRAGRNGTAVPDTIRVTDGEAGDTIFVVMPLGAPDRRLGPTASQIAVFMQQANRFVPLATEVWARLFGLTGGELRVLQALIEGATPPEIAAVYGIAISTVRTHLVSLFRKTGTRRQADLVKLALSSVPPVRLG